MARQQQEEPGESRWNRTLAPEKSGCRSEDRRLPSREAGSRRKDPKNYIEKNEKRKGSNGQKHKTDRGCGSVHGIVRSEPVVRACPARNATPECPSAMPEPTAETRLQ